MLEARKKFIAMFALSILFSMITGILLVKKMQSLHQQFGDYVPVVVARQSIPARTPVSPEMLETKEIPRKFAFTSLFHSIDQAAGHVFIVPLMKGDMVTKSMVREIPETGDKMRIVNLTQSERVLFDEPLDPADHVDIIVSYQEGEKPVTKVLMEDVPIGRIAEEKEKQRAIGVELTIDDAQKLIFMQNFSQQIRILKHPVLEHVQ